MAVALWLCIFFKLMLNVTWFDEKNSNTATDAKRMRKYKQTQRTQ